MNAGALDRRALIEIPSGARDAYGALVPGWTTLATVWARVTPATGRELAALGAQISSAAYSVRIRYRTDVAEDARVTVDGRVLSIKSVSEVGRKEWTDFMCEVVK